MISLNCSPLKHVATLAGQNRCIFKHRIPSLPGSSQTVLLHKDLQFLIPWHTPFFTAPRVEIHFIERHSSKELQQWDLLLGYCCPCRRDTILQGDAHAYSFSYNGLHRDEDFPSGSSWQQLGKIEALTARGGTCVPGREFTWF